MPDFQIDPRIASDSVPVTSLALSDLRLMNDRRFPWLILVPRWPAVAEIIDLPESDRTALFSEVVQVSAALRAATGCDKLNVGALGNIVRQLHVHVVARFKGDSAWPGPVWGSGASVPYAADEVERLVGQLTAAGIA